MEISLNIHLLVYVKLLICKTIWFWQRLILSKIDILISHLIQLLITVIPLRYLLDDEYYSIDIKSQINIWKVKKKER